MASRTHSLSRQFAASSTRIGRKYREIQLSSCSCNSRDPDSVLLRPAARLHSFPLVLAKQQAAAACERSRLENKMKKKKKEEEENYRGVETTINKYSRVVLAFLFLSLYPLAALYTVARRERTVVVATSRMFHELVISRHLWPSLAKRGFSASTLFAHLSRPFPSESSTRAPVDDEIAARGEIFFPGLRERKIPGKKHRLWRIAACQGWRNGASGEKSFFLAGNDKTELTGARIITTRILFYSSSVFDSRYQREREREREREFSPTTTFPPCS